MSTPGRTGRKGLEDWLKQEYLDLAGQRLVEGLDATVVKAKHTRKGWVYSAPLPAWTDRRETSKELLHLADWYPAKEDHESQPVTVVINGMETAQFFGTVRQGALAPEVHELLVSGDSREQPRGVCAETVLKAVST